MKKALLVNPYIHDFKLYDEWMKPLGLYYVADYLYKNNIEIAYINCLTREHPDLKYCQTNQKEKKYHTGDFHSEELERPIIFNGFQRKYKRYGIPINLFRKDIESIGDIDFILVTSYMTYWYQGVFETISILREYYPDKPLFIGGIYATLCYEHAKNNSNLSDVLTGHFNEQSLQKIFNHIKLDKDIIINKNPFPKYDIEPSINHIPLLISFGCPYDCSYCANKFINKEFYYNNKKSILKTIDYYYSIGIRDFAFYDDALLYKFDENLYHILKHIIDNKMDCNLHTPNAIHSRFITENVANMMYQSGFKTIRIGFETTNPILQKKTGNKTNTENLITAVKNLKNAGFQKENIGIYIMIGLKEQTIEEIQQSIDFIASLSVLVKPVTYSPIPHTKEFEKYATEFPEIEREPLYQNDSFFIIHSGFTTFDWLNSMKDYVRKINQL
jgi:radical SAM superfamily enzyme YgiQ (UPF0313 family)